MSTPTLEQRVDKLEQYVYNNLSIATAPKPTPVAALTGKTNSPYIGTGVTTPNGPQTDGRNVSTPVAAGLREVLREAVESGRCCDGYCDALGMTNLVVAVVAPLLAAKDAKEKDLAATVMAYLSDNKSLRAQLATVTRERDEAKKLYLLGQQNTQNTLTAQDATITTLRKDLAALRSVADMMKGYINQLSPTPGSMSDDCKQAALTAYRALPQPEAQK